MSTGSPGSVTDDLRAEADALHAFFVTLSASDWQRPTGFKDWTPWDVLAHLHYFDEVSLHAADGETAFSSRRKALVESVGEGLTAQALHRRDFGDLDAATLLERWRATLHVLAERLARLPPKTRLPWFGPDMSARMFASARFMETWSHAQAIYDLLGARRVHTDRIRHVVAIGVRTFAWTFANRGLDVPGPPPRLRLGAPSGAVWTYNEENDAERIEGEAVDFCFTVTQARNVADTTLDVSGDVATRWMELAQCFAGPPVDPPAPGSRRGAV